MLEKPSMKVFCLRCCFIFYYLIFINNYYLIIINDDNSYIKKAFFNLTRRNWNTEIKINKPNPSEGCNIFFYIGLNLIILTKHCYLYLPSRALLLFIVGITNFWFSLIVQFLFWDILQLIGIKNEYPSALNLVLLIKLY